MAMTFLPAGAALAEAAPWILKGATWSVGFAAGANIFTWAGQRFLGQNQKVNAWVNKELKDTILA
jgi:hypothetical protein